MKNYLHVEQNPQQNISKKELKILREFTAKVMVKVKSSMAVNAKVLKSLSVQM
jgi:hypothetical protein